MADYTTWRRNAFENSRPSPDGWPPSHPPRDVNNIAREMQSALAFRRDRLGTYPTSTGDEENTYRVDVPLTLTEIPLGFTLGFTAHQSSIAADATLQLNDFTPAALYGSEDTGIAAADIVAGRRYDVVYTALGWAVIFLRQTDDAGQVALSAIPNTLTGIDAGMSGGLVFSSADPAVPDANTLYFRTINGGEIYRGADRVESVAHGSTPITTIQHGADYVYAIARQMTDVVIGLIGPDVVMTWTAPLIASEPVNYRVQRSSDPNFGTLESEDVTSATTFTFSDVGTLFEEETQHIRVRAENYIGGSLYVSDFITITPPTRVQLLSVTYDGNTATATLTWVAPTDGTLPFTYRPRRTQAGGGTIILPEVTALTTTDGPLATGQTYRYRVQAINGAGEGPLSTQFSINT